jgi:hypothetical protein
VRALLAAAAAAACLIVALPLALVAATSASSSLDQTTTGYGTAPADIPAHLVPLYQAAAKAYNVPWLLLAAIHEQETTFSTLDAPGVCDGANGCGAAGPMQFGIVGVAPYNATAPDCGPLTGTGAGDSWNHYKNARDELTLDASTADVVTDRPPACRAVPATTGCVYADLDAIAAAAAYLYDLGAQADLDDAAWQAAKSYNGASVYADAVMARARLWQSEELDDVAQTDPTTTTTPGARAHLQVDGLAQAPADAPDSIAHAIQAANEISDRGYALRHWPTHIDNPTYDCSSATSHVLWGAGAFGTAPWVSGDLMHYGDPGPGRWITVYANAGHAFVVVAGRRFDTARYDSGPNAGESGPRWRLGTRPTANFVVRHPPGL